MKPNELQTPSAFGIADELDRLAWNQAELEAALSVHMAPDDPAAGSWRRFCDVVLSIRRSRGARGVRELAKAIRRSRAA